MQRRSVQVGIGRVRGVRGLIAYSTSQCMFLARQAQYPIKQSFSTRFPLLFSKDFDHYNEMRLSHPSDDGEEHATLSPRRLTTLQ